MASPEPMFDPRSPSIPPTVHPEDQAAGRPARPADPHRDRPDPVGLILDRVVGHWPSIVPALAVVLVVCVAGWWLLRPEPRPPIETLLPTAAEVDPGPLPTVSADPVAATSLPTPTEIVVHVAGAVVRPGLVTIADPARVADVVAAAGGLVVGADADRINLAAPVADGERIFVPSVGQVEIPSVAAGSGGGGSTGSTPPLPGAGVTASVDLNTADQAALEALPGVGPATALAILAHRDANGPFVRIDDLLEVRGIGPAKLDQIRPFVTVG